VVTLRGGTSVHTGQFSEAELRQYLQPRGPLWGFGEIGLWHEEYQSVTFDSPHMQTIFQLVNESKGIVMIHPSTVSQGGGRPTELTEVEPSIRKYPDAIFLFHSKTAFDLVAQLMSKYPNVYYSVDFGNSFSQGKGVSLKTTDASRNNAASFLAGVNRTGLDYMVELNLKALAPRLQQYPDRIFWGTDLSEPWHFEEPISRRNMPTRMPRGSLGVSSHLGNEIFLGDAIIQYHSCHNLSTTNINVLYLHT
ncbi:hypothetical protein ACFLV4_05960, partial [Chloroflexota bacterium]